MIPFANALPKSGTNLAQKLLELMGFQYDQLGIASSLILGSNYMARQLTRGALFDKNPIQIGFEAPVSISSRWLSTRLSKVAPNGYISGHANYSERLHQILLENKVKTIHILRDPRDVLVSSAHFFAKKKDYYLYPLFSKLAFEERIKGSLEGGLFPEIGLRLESFHSCLEKVAAWQDKQDVLFIKFEDLIGEQGGGSKKNQLETIQNVANFIGFDASQEKTLHVIAEQLFGGTHTFRKGVIGSWKDELSQEMANKIESNLSDFLNLWDYK